ncbi:hypothetical protein RJT34_06568 [Clitoria ternatea]|uniref:Uncharacterized protein n=1 Tax=Clitoria ternatea TaxID=43366 RepID=A0AAN9K3W4_CLITE
MDETKLVESIDKILEWIHSVNGHQTQPKDLLKDIQDILIKTKETNHVKVLLWRLQLQAVLKDLQDITSLQESKYPYLSKIIPNKNRPNAQIVDELIRDLEDLRKKGQDLPNGRKLAQLLDLDPAFEEKSEAVGREREKKEVMEQLLFKRNGENLPPVVTILGIAGIGKTKLAQLVCEEEKLKNQVGLPVVCDIHDKLNMESITGTCVSVAKAHAAQKRDMLVILDDLRIEIDLKALQVKLKEADLSVGAIIITTRSNLVADKIAASPSSVKTLTLQGLNENDAWSLFQKMRMTEQDATDDDDDLRRMVVEQCRGVPLAIITLTKLLGSGRFKQDEQKMADLTKEFFHELTYTYTNDNQLPTNHHKLCFAYCSLFPQDFLIDVERLKHLWLGEEYIDSPEKGEECMKHFLGMSIFQDMEEDECGVVRTCRMNPFMHDIARFAFDGDENITMDPDGRKVHNRVLRVFFDSSIDLSRGIPDSLFEKAKNLRSILFVGNTESPLPQPTFEKILKSFKRLRILDLHDMGIKTVPSSIGEAKELRYLDLSLNSIEKLPNSITKLSNLQTLKLSRCYLLQELPKDLEDLTKLRHLDIDGCLGLTHMPRKMSKLSETLQTLSLFVASKNDPMGGLGELANLNNLTGHLEILHLEQVKVSATSNNDKLKRNESGSYNHDKSPEEKSSWTSNNNKPEEKVAASSNNNKPEEKAAAASNNSKLGDLWTKKVSASSNNNKPEEKAAASSNNNKLGDFWKKKVSASSNNNKPDEEFLKKKQQLRGLTLRWEHDDEDEEKDNEKGVSDNDLKSLDCIEPHSNLKVLFFVGYKGVTLSKWFASIQGLIKVSLFDCAKCESLGVLDQLKHLKLLELVRLDKLEYISENCDEPVSFFHTLKELTISDCPELRGWWKEEKKGKDKPFFTCISKLHVQYCPKLTCMPLFYRLDKELVLVASSIEPLKDSLRRGTDESGFVPFSKLKSLQLASIEEHSAPERTIQNFTSLENLHIRDCHHLEILPLGFKHLSSLQSLTIENCSKLDLDLSRTELEGLRSLRSLMIREIPKLRSLPSGVDNVTSLQDLELHNCHELTTMPETVGKLASLGRMVISECNKLASLPKEMKNLKALRTLIILDCALLLPRCQPETGDDWPQIKHVKNIQVKETYQDF